MNGVFQSCGNSHTVLVRLAEIQHWIVTIGGGGEAGRERERERLDYQIYFSVKT